MKFIKLCSLSFFLMLYSAFSEDKSSEIEVKIANEPKQQEVLIGKFKELFTEKLSQGDKTAVALAKKAQKNAGNLNLGFEEMKKLMTSWDKSSLKDFNKLPTEKEKTQFVKEKFEKLLKARVAAKDDEATKLTKQGLLNGKISLSVRQMEEFILKWE